MSKRRTHSPEFKARVAMEAISDRKTIQEIAADHAIHPIQVSQWKRQLLDGARELFTRGKKSKDMEEGQAKEAELFQQIGRLQMELEWLQKSLSSLIPVNCASWSITITPHLSLRSECALLGLPRSTLYYRPTPVRETTLRIMAEIDAFHLEDPCNGSHADNGNAMRAATLESSQEELGVLRSFSRPRVSNDNLCSESLFRTVKYRPDYPRKPFTSKDEACQWLASFFDWYNHQHRHSGIKFVMPQQRHCGQAEEISHHRALVYEQARQLNPRRWSRSTRCWHQPEVVWIKQPPDDLDQGQKLPLMQPV